MRGAGRAWAWTSALAGLCACARPAETRAPAIAAGGPTAASAPGDPVDDATGDASLRAPADEQVAAAEPVREGRVVMVDPPQHSSGDAGGGEVWGDLEGSPIGEDYGVGCPHWAVVPPPPTRDGRRPVVTLRSLAVEGALARPSVAPIVRARREDVAACQLEAMAQEPEPAGTLRVRLVVDAQGSVDEAAVSGIDALVGCVRRAAIAWRFPRAGAGTTITVTLAVGGEQAPPWRQRCRR